MCREAPWLDSLPLPGSAIPVLFLHGTKDAVFPKALVEKGVAKLREAGHNVTLIEIEGYRHAPVIGRFDDVWNWFQAHPCGAD